MLEGRKEGGWVGGWTRETDGHACIRAYVRARRWEGRRLVLYFGMTTHAEEADTYLQGYSHTRYVDTATT